MKNRPTVRRPDHSRSGSQPDPCLQPSSPPDLNSHPDPKSPPNPKPPPDPGADPEAKPKPARRSGRTGTSAKPRRRKQRKPATYAIYNELVQRLPMRASNDPILGMPLERYLEMAQVAAAGILDKRRERQGEVVHPMSLPMKIVMWLAALGINAANWFNTLDDFEQLFQCGSTA
jgi:hypothetical protein